MKDRYHYVFPRWSNALLPSIGILGAAAPIYAFLLVSYGFSPLATDVGYQPEQPVPYSHRIHVGNLGIDCRYCHNTVEYAAKAAIPPTQTCMNCHTQVYKESVNLTALFDSYATGMPVKWKRVHDLPDYAYFDHSAHVNRGVSCVECHGRVDKMDVVIQEQPLNMGWCLSCHRKPQGRVRDPLTVTDLGWSFEEDSAAKDQFKTLEAYSAFWLKHNNISPSQDCSTCHR